MIAPTPIREPSLLLHKLTSVTIIPNNAVNENQQFFVKSKNNLFSALNQP